VYNLIIKRNDRTGSQKMRARKRKALLEAAEGSAEQIQVGPVVGFLLSLSANDPPSAGQEKKRHRGH
jgi:hypothetical protein